MSVRDCTPPEEGQSPPCAGDIVEEGMTVFVVVVVWVDANEGETE